MLPVPDLRPALVAIHVYAQCALCGCASVDANAPPQPVSSGKAAVVICIPASHLLAQGVLRVLRACKCRRLDRVRMQLPPASPLEELSLAGAAPGLRQGKRLPRPHAMLYM